MEQGKMMRYLRVGVMALFAVVLTACGGGGNPGGSSSSGGSSGGSTSSPSIFITLENAAGVTLNPNTISKSANYYAKAIVKNASGAVAANQLVTFSTNYAIATLVGNVSDFMAMTNESGVAKVLISPLSLTTSGAAALTATTTISSITVSAGLNFSTSVANVTLSSLSASPASLAALGTSNISAIGLVDGVASSGVVVNFTASCGTFSPSSVTTRSSGIANSTYQSLSECGGTTVIVTASASGAIDQNSTIVVAAAKATNLLFNGVTSPTTGTIYVSTSPAGVKNATLKFKVVDSSGTTGLRSQAVSFSLPSTVSAAGVTFASSTTTGVTTDSDGYVSITVQSGAIPVPVVVIATLDSNIAITASSNSLAVTSGTPSQIKAQFEPVNHSLEALNYTGLTTQVTFSVSDRSGNSVPDRTTVTFVAGSGHIDGSCFLMGSTCTVTYTANGTAPSNGRDFVLAYLDGEESFVDANGDGIYNDVIGATPRENFTDTGSIYKDIDGSQTFSTGDELVLGGATGNTTCAFNSTTYPSVIDTCDGQWSRAIKVRKSTIITWASGLNANIKLDGVRSASGFAVLVEDASGRGNAMPSGSTVAAAITSMAPICTVKSVTLPTISGSSSRTTLHQIALDRATDCATVEVTVTITTPKGSVSRVKF